MLDIADAVLLLKDEELSEIVKVISPKILVLGKQFEINPEVEVSNSEVDWPVDVLPPTPTKSIAELFIAAVPVPSC